MSAFVERRRVADGMTSIHKPHVCPPLSEELQWRIEAEIAECRSQYGNSYERDTELCVRVEALKWVLREASSLESKTGTHQKG